MTIKIFTTGGTIDKTYFDQKDAYHVGEPQVAGILERANVTVNYEIVPLLQKDSLDLDAADRALISASVEACHERHIIITHGTDSMVETAKALHQVVTDKTVILTGAMYPAQYRDSDAVFNMGCAIIAAQSCEFGVYLVMNGRILNPLTTSKNIAMNTFEEQ